MQEGIITRDTMINVGRRRYMDLTEAMAHSNNTYFESVGERLGFEAFTNTPSFSDSAKKPAINLPDEQPGTVPEVSPAFGGVARMSSFGEGIRITPLQMASLVSTLANGGTMYYLQYPQTAEQRANFTPRVKRRLDIAPLLPDLGKACLPPCSTAPASPATILTANRLWVRPAPATMKRRAAVSAGSFLTPISFTRKSSSSFFSVAAGLARQWTACR